MKGFLTWLFLTLFLVLFLPFSFLFLFFFFGDQLIDSNLVRLCVACCVLRGCFLFPFFFPSRLSHLVSRKEKNNLGSSSGGGCVCLCLRWQICVCVLCRVVSCRCGFCLCISSPFFLPLRASFFSPLLSYVPGFAVDRVLPSCSLLTAPPPRPYLSLSYACILFFFSFRFEPKSYSCLFFCR